MNKFSDDLLDAVTSILKGVPVEEKKSLDPVDKKELKGKHSDREDGDLDNDGDEDDSDEYLHKKRKAISKSMNKEATDHDPKHVKQAIGIASDPRYKKGNMTGAVKAMNKLSKGIENHPQVAAVLKKQNEQAESYLGHSDAEKLNGGKSKDSNFKSAASHIDYHHRRSGGHEKSGGAQDQHRYQVAKKLGYHVEESKDLNTDNVEKALKHDCATHVEHADWGLGNCIPGMHTIEEVTEDTGIVTHYDVMFEHGIEENVPVTELKVIKSMNHGHPRKKKEG